MLTIDINEVVAFYDTLPPSRQKWFDTLTLRQQHEYMTKGGILQDDKDDQEERQFGWSKGQ
jgi:hypothetical protein